MLSILPKPWVKEVPLRLKKHGVLIGVTREAFFPLCLPSQKRERERERERARASESSNVLKHDERPKQHKSNTPSSCHFGPSIVEPSLPSKSPSKAGGPWWPGGFDLPLKPGRRRARERERHGERDKH